MNSLLTQSPASSLSNSTVVFPASGLGDRLIVLLPASELDTPALSQHIWGIARSFQLNVLLISLFDHPDEESQLRRQMITLVSMIQDPNITIDIVIASGNDWVNQVQLVCKSGDIVACYAGHKAGTLQKPLDELLRASLGVPVYVLTGAGTLKKSQPSFLSEFAFWVGLLTIIGGFFWVQVKLVQLPHDWENIALIYACMFLEIPLILIWTAIFRKRTYISFPGRWRMSNMERTQVAVSNDLAGEYERQQALPDTKDVSIKQRSGTLDLRVVQGQALALDRNNELIALIKERAASGNLNRGITLSLPYFNAQKFRIDTRKIEIIPAGRVMFVPAFVVLAMRREEKHISQDKRLDSITRDHLLDLLERYEQAFEIP